MRLLCQLFQQSQQLLRHVAKHQNGEKPAHKLILKVDRIGELVFNCAGSDEISC